MKYLRIDFHDNDFGLCVRLALERLWKDLNENNHGGDTPFSDRTIPQMFELLHKIGILLPLVMKAIDCENNWSNIEFTTRGLYWEKVKWVKKGVKEELESVKGYLNIDISFYKTKRFTKKWNNGESVWLDLENGEAGSF